MKPLRILIPFLLGTMPLAVAQASERPDHDDITMHVIENDDVKHIENEIELPDDVRKEMSDHSAKDDDKDDHKDAHDAKEDEKEDHHDDAKDDAEDSHDEAKEEAEDSHEEAHEEAEQATEDKDDDSTSSTL